MTNLQQDRIYILYNADKQEKIGLFKAYPAKKFVFEGHSKFPVEKLLRSTYNKSTIYKSRLPFKVAIRFGYEEERKTLGNKEYIILNDNYKQYIVGICIHSSMCLGEKTNPKKTILLKKEPVLSLNKKRQIIIDSIDWAKDWDELTLPEMVDYLELKNVKNQFEKQVRNRYWNDQLRVKHYSSIMQLR